MQTEPRNSGDLSQDFAPAVAHQTTVTPLSAISSPAVIDPTARASKSAYRNLNSASVGLELGIAVMIGLGMGWYLDRELGTGPWLMLLFLGFGFVAGFRGVLRAVRREDQQATHG